MSKTNDYNLFESTIWDLKDKDTIRKWIKNNIVFLPYNTENRSLNKPVLIKTNLYSFFKCLEEEAKRSDSCIVKYPLDTEREKVQSNIASTKKRLMHNLNYLLNSSIWIRFCDSDDSASIADAENEFSWFTKIHLYDYKPANEYLEYQLRIQQQNYLSDVVGAHGEHVIPTLYSNEVEFRDFFINNKRDVIEFKFLDKKDENSYYTQDVSLRVLLVDDKISKNNKLQDNNEVTLRKCDDSCTGCEEAANCKLRVIRSLMSGAFIEPGTEKSDVRECFHNSTYWADAVDSYVVNGTVHANCIWEKRTDADKLELKKDYINNLLKDLDLSKSKNYKGVQIVGVRDLESALSLLSCCKFDIILLDYLLNKEPEESGLRPYSTELFEFLSYKPEQEEPRIVTKVKERAGFNDAQLKEFQDNVKLNRGPLDKFWVIPMTSYNSSFISDLQRKHVRLIDHRWNISQGADPINTPWKFLYKLNEFIDLQLRQSVFWKEQLLTFLQFTCEDYIDRFNKKHTVKGNDGQTCFDDFQSFMGAEYANFMKRYGARKLIERDADEGEGINQSLFAKNIKDTFYSNFTKYEVELELNRLMQDFYRQAAVMYNDREGRKRLRESYERLRIFIAYNDLTSILKSTEELCKGLQKLRLVIDAEFDVNKINKGLNKK